MYDDDDDDDGDGDDDDGDDDDDEQQQQWALFTWPLKKHCKSTLRITKIIVKANQITIIKLSKINCLASLNRMMRIVLIAC